MKRRPRDLPTVAESFGVIRADYEAAKSSQFVRRRTGIASAGSGADYHYRNESEYLRIMELARDIDRNDMLVGQGISRAVDNCLQGGVNPDPQTGDTEVDDLLLADWQEWSQTPRLCHSEHRLTWLQIERLLFRAAFFVDGDQFCLPTDSDSLWLVEAHRVRTPKKTTQRVVHGLKFNDRDEWVETWITKEDLDPNKQLNLVRDVQPYPAFDDAGNPLTWHVFDPRRVTQRRGIGVMCPVAKASGMSDDAFFGMLVKLQVSSCIAIVRELFDGGGTPPGVIGTPEMQTASDGTRKLIEHIYPGMEVVGKLGEKLSMFSPNIATVESMAFSMLVLSIIAVNLGIPVAVLLLDPSNTNFSGWRGAIDQARLGFKRLVKDYINQFHCRVWNWRVRVLLQRTGNPQSPSIRRAMCLQELIGQKIKGGDGASAFDPFKHRWNAQSYGYIEPLKDATADGLRLEKLLTSPRRLWAEKGADWFQGVDEIVEDNRYAIAAAINSRRKLIDGLQGDDKTLAESVHWRELLCLTTTANLSIAVNTQDSEPAPSTGGGNRA